MAGEARPELIAFVGLGANLGDPQAMLRWALDALAHTSGVRLVQASALYRSAPVDASGPTLSTRSPKSPPRSTPWRC